MFIFRITHHIEALVGVLIVLALVQRTVHICETCPVASQIVCHGVNSIEESDEVQTGINNEV